MRIRIKFTKEESVKYLGHLDIMRAFQKCMNRAQVKMTYSEGFSPHQKMSFALPLGVGMTSKAEYMDCEIADGQDTEEIKKNLNKACGLGFNILCVKELGNNAEKAMKAVKYADFAVCFANSYNDDRNFNNPSREKCFLNNDLEGFLAQKEIITLKRTKSKEKQEDIRPMIIDGRIDGKYLLLRLAAGSENNLKAETVLKALHEYLNKPFDKYEFSIERRELLGDGFVALEDLGTV